MSSNAFGLLSMWKRVPPACKALASAATSHSSVERQQIVKNLKFGFRGDRVRSHFVQHAHVTNSDSWSLGDASTPKVVTKRWVPLTATSGSLRLTNTELIIREALSECRVTFELRLEPMTGGKSRRTGCRTLGAGLSKLETSWYH